MLRAAFAFLNPRVAGGVTYAGYALSALSLVAGVAAHPRPATPHGFHYVPSHAPLHIAPVPAAAPRHFTITAGAVPHVRGVITRDTHVDISQAINQAADSYGFSAPGFAALMGVESGWNQYAPHYPIAGAGGCDYSGGLTQITVCTAAGLGVGDGTLSSSNIQYVFSYEQADPVRDVWLSAKLVARMKAKTCFDFTILYAAWNEGDGYGCGSDLYVHPQNWITQNAVQVYNTWWSDVWASFVTYAPTPKPTPKPKPRPYTFPYHAFEQYRDRHHLVRISPWQHHRETWPAWLFKSHQSVGGIVDRGRWVPQRRHGFDVYHFAHRNAVCWPDFHRCVLTRRS